MAWCWRVIAIAAASVGLCVYYARGLGPTANFYQLPWMIRIAGEPLAGSALLLTLWLDRRRNPDRDWLHWTGVLVVLALAAIDVGQSAWTLMNW